MIHYTSGNLFDAEVEALVNPVNTVGVMGKGIALAFKKRYPDNMQQYALACKQRRVVVGKIFVTKTSGLMGPRWIVNFPTKQHWRGKSQLHWVVDGLAELRRFIVDNDVRSIAIPALGAGLGGLEWVDVKPRIGEALTGLDAVEVFVYEPIP